MDGRSGEEQANKRLSCLLVAPLYLAQMVVVAFVPQYVNVFALVVGIGAAAVIGARYFQGRAEEHEEWLAFYFLFTGLFLYFRPDLFWIWLIITVTAAMIFLPLYVALRGRS